MQTPDSWEDVKTDDKIEQIPTQEYAIVVDTPGLVLVNFGGNNDVFIAAMVVLLVFLLVTIVGGCADGSSASRNRGEYDCDASPQRIIHEIGPGFNCSSPHNHENDLITSYSNSMPKDDQLQQYNSTLDVGIEQSLVTDTSMSVKDSKSITENFDSGFSSLQSNTSLQLPSQQFTSKSAENCDSGLGLEESLTSQIQPTDESNGASDTPNHVKSLFSEREELDNEDAYDLTDVRDDIAHEAGLICLSSDQLMTLCDASLLENPGLECDTSSTSVSLDCEKFILEEGPKEPSFLCPSMQNAGISDTNPADAVNQPNYNDINHSAMISFPISFNYNDPLYPRHEVEINMKLEGSETIHGVAVTVESSAVQDLCSLALPPKLPDINISQPFIHHYGAHDYSAESVNMLQDYPDPIQARNSKKLTTILCTFHRLFYPHNPYNSISDDPVDDVLPNILADEDPDHNNYDLQIMPNVAPEFSEDISSDAPSCSEDDDHDRFSPSLPEERPREPSLLSLSIQNATAQANQPISIFRGDRDSRNGDQEQPNSENEQPTESDVLPSGTPMPIIYDDPPYPHQENEIQVKLEATKDMQGAAVTVEDSQFEDLTSLVPPPRPPDININHLFVHHRGPPAVQYSIATLQDYPRPIQEAGHPLPSK